MAVGSQGRGRSNSLPNHVVEYLKEWLMSPDHVQHPYPSESEKARMVAETGIELKRLNNWFVNNRIRYWKPRFEALQKQQQPKKKISIPHVQESGSPLKPTPTHPTQSASEEEYVQAIKAISATKGITPEVARRDSIAPASPIGSLVHQVSDASLDANDSISTSSSLDDDQQDFHSISAPQKRPAVDVVAFDSPTQSIKRPRVKVDDYGSGTVTCPRYVQKNAEQWKQVCLSSSGLDDQCLPTLDEAAFLFGYSVAV
jgi:hypothetical protein